jgi:hypothetical protein
MKNTLGLLLQSSNQKLDTVSVLAFCHYDKTPEKINFKEEGFILTHDFRGFSLWSADTVAFRPVARLQHHGVGHGRGKLLTSWQPGSRKCERKRGWGTRYTLQRHVPLPMTYFLLAALSAMDYSTDDVSPS